MPLTPEEKSELAKLRAEKQVAELSGPDKALFAARSALEGHTLGISEPIVSGVKAVATSLSQDKPFSEAYEADVQNRKAEKAANRGLDIAAQIGGGLLPSPVNVGAKVFGVGSAIAKGAGLTGRTLLPTVGRGAVSGGATGFGMGVLKETVGRPTGFVTEGTPGKNIAKDTAIGMVLGIPGELLINKLEAIKAARVQADPNKAKVVEAGKILNAEPTPGQLTDNQLVGQLESSIEQQPIRFGVGSIKDKIKKSREATEIAAKEIGAMGTSKTSTEIGSQVKKGLIERIKERVRPAKEIYEKLEGKLSKSEAVILNTNNAVAEVKELALVQSQLKGIANTAPGSLENVRTVQDLKNLRTSIGDMLTEKLSPVQRRAITRLYDAITADRKASLLKYKPELADKLDEADRIWAEASKIIENALPFKNAKPSSIARKANAVSDTKIADKIFNTTDIPKLESLAKEFPREFNLLRENRIRKVFEKAGGDANRIVKTIRALEPEAQAMILGKDALKKIGAIETWIKAHPDMSGPSGTPAGQQVARFVMSMITGLGPFESVGKGLTYKLLTEPKIAPMVRRLTEQGINVSRQVPNPLIVDTSKKN